jgi:hypothetical protein
MKTKDRWVIEPTTWDILESSQNPEHEDLVIVAVKDPNKRFASTNELPQTINTSLPDRCEGRTR